MKKLLLVLIAGFVLMAAPAKAQDPRDFKFTIKTNPLNALGGPFWVTFVPITGEYKVLFEAKVSPKSSFQAGLGLIGPSLLLNMDELSSDESSISGIKTSGFRAQVMYKIFLSRDLSAPEGFYVGPHFSYASAKIKSKDNAADNIGATKMNINGVLGYQMISSGGFTLDIYTGLGLVIKNWDIAGSDWDDSFFKDKSSVSVPLGLSFGYAF